MRSLRFIFSRILPPVVSAVAAVVFLFACANKTDKGPLTRQFPTVQVPAIYSDDSYGGVMYAAEHFWDDFLDTLHRYVCDSVYVGGVEKLAVEQQYAQYVALLRMCSLDDARSSIRRMYSKTADVARADTASTVFETLREYTERYLYDPNSPVRDEDIYGAYTAELANYEGYSPIQRSVYEREAKMCSLNMKGTPAADFKFKTADGRTESLYGIQAEYTLLFFSNPGCPACKEIIDVLSSEPLFVEAVRQGWLAIANVYIDEERTEWYKYMPIYPKTWHNGYDDKGIIRGETLYDVRAIPSLYLLDKDKTVLLKDADNQVVFNVMANIFETINNHKIMIDKALWGTSPNGKEIFKYRMTNASGAYVEVSSVGAGIVAIVVPDKDGKLADVALGYPDPLSYFADGPCAGKVPGRFANRIGLGKFSIDGNEYKLVTNNPACQLHGGPEGFQNQVWDSRVDGNAVEFMYFSKDGEMGYPGNLKAVARYEWSDANALQLTLTAECDAPTVINLTNHAYFNLKGEGNGDILDHELKLNASRFLPTNDAQVPTGEIWSVHGTPMDFTEAKLVGKDINEDYVPLKQGKGYDHCWVIDASEEGQIQTAAELYSPQSGRCLEILTTQPAVQVYTGNWLDGSPVGKCGRSYRDHEGIAMECQNFPDAPNHDNFPSPVLRPGQTYQQAIIFAFSVR